MSVLVVDTDILSFAFKGDTRIQPYQSTLKNQSLIISFMTLAELSLWGNVKHWGEKRKHQLSDYLRQNFAVCPSTDDLCDIWAELKAEARTSGVALDTADAWIAATAVCLDAPLVTHNYDDFKFLAGLQVISFSPQ